MTQEHRTEQECVTLHLPSRLEYIRPIQAFIGQLAQQKGFGESRIHDIELVIDEMCGNAIEHGSEPQGEGIDLIIISDSNRLEILVRDKGKKSQVDWLNSGRLDEVSRRRAPDKARGHGIYITEELSDHLDIEPNALGGTDVKVIFNLSPP